MQQKIQASVAGATNLPQVRDALLQLFKTIQSEEEVTNIGYVGGMIFSEGPEHVEKNIRILNEHTQRLRNEYTFPLFSAVDIFYEGLYQNLREATLPYAERRGLFLTFWQEIVGSGFITDIFMTPRWEMSEGATDEHQTAKKKGITIHYVK